MTRSTGATARVIARMEASYRTAGTGSWFLLPMLSTDFQGDTPLIADDVLGGGRRPLSAEEGISTVAGTHRVPLDTRAIGYWLRLLLGNPTTSGTTTRTHVFNDGVADLPSTQLEIGHERAALFPLHGGVMVDRMVIPYGGDGLATADLSLVGADEASPFATATAGASPTTYTYRRFGQRNSSVVFSNASGFTVANIASARIQTAQVTIENGLDPMRDPNGNVSAMDPGLNRFSIDLTARFTNDALLTAATGGTPVKITCEHNISASLLLRVELNEVRLQRPSRSIQGPGGVQATLRGVAGRPSSGQSAVVTLINDITGYTGS